MWLAFLAEGSRGSHSALMCSVSQNGSALSMAMAEHPEHGMPAASNMHGLS